jgi:hypothetical protein
VSIASYQRGSIFFALFASIGMVAAIGVATMNLMKGPVRAMANVTKHTVAENAMIANGKLALIMSASTPGDCDHDGRIEPLEWSDPGTTPAPVNGGLLPASIGASLQDPWGRNYGYCAWDHGTLSGQAGCGVGAHRLKGGMLPAHPVVAVVSSGPDQVFQTGCLPEGQASFVLKQPGSDDLVLTYTYAEAMAMAGNLWNLKPDDSETATIAKNLSVTDEGGAEQLSFDAQTKALSLGTGGIGELPNIKTDYIQNLSENAPVEFLSAIKAGPATIETEEANAVAAIVTSSGSAGVGLKASGTSKAIEAEGLIDMINHKIVNLAAPDNESDAATKKYVDDKLNTGKRVKCDAFVFSSCTPFGASAQNLTKTSLGDCKRACENAGVQCCEVEFTGAKPNPNTALTSCKGYAHPAQTSNSLANLLGGILVPNTTAAFCYEQY